MGAADPCPLEGQRGTTALFLLPHVRLVDLPIGLSTSPTRSSHCLVSSTLCHQTKRCRLRDDVCQAVSSGVDAVEREVA
uniref:Uncharacterized protein n=1 Tax=Timema poppense TaxID=170557 RepID=A0A7R9DHW4_TIMPO|nr:unnamed protein product [Timema poppensis]